MTRYVVLQFNDFYSFKCAYDALVDAGYSEEHSKSAGHLYDEIVGHRHTVQALVGKSVTIGVGVDEYRDILGIFNVGSTAAELVARDVQDLVDKSLATFPLEGK